MNEELPVSIITPVLNNAKYVGTCIESVLGQEYASIEHILVDGGSTDGTLDIIEEYRSRNTHRIRLMSGPDRGVGDAINKGMKAATGDIFGWLDADSLLAPGAIAALADYFRANPEAAFVFGRGDIIDADGHIIGSYPVKDFSLEEAVHNRCYIHVQSAYFRRIVVERVGYYNDLGNCHEFWVRAGREFAFHRIDAVIALNRQDKDGIFFSSDPNKRKVLRARLKEDHDFCRQYGGTWWSPRCRRYYLFNVIEKLGLYSLAVRLFLMPRRRYTWLDSILRKLGF